MTGNKGGELNVTEILVLIQTHILPWHTAFKYLSDKEECKS